MGRGLEPTFLTLTQNSDEFEFLAKFGKYSDPE